MCKPLDEANALIRSLDVILLGIESDAVEALSPYRTERAVQDVKQGLKSARSAVNQLLTSRLTEQSSECSPLKFALSKETHAIAQTGIDGA